MSKPVALPTHAPMAREGRKIPAGTEAPKVMAVRIVLAKAVTRRRRTIVPVWEELPTTSKEDRYLSARSMRAFR